MKRSIQAVLLSALLSAGGASAHPNHDDDPMLPKRAATPRASYAVSGATTDGVVRVTINREGAKVTTANAHGFLVVEGNAARTEYALRPEGENIMVTRDKLNLASGTRVTIAVSLADRSNVREEVTLR